ncbi:hypothetical protein [Gynuella sunshinyii]|uniref:Uncharacterized protein n=1 Tax=Gynuella sunshinyii YC6258 TaxID=1445510 RepID=A0A0C5V3A9_9GAMM|nr:hypothetical protein [Gynuella sunshinyii]AJQ94020.1 hypothetical Protein YC6258_01976 [Gynuella sunshinyii YC6258]
MFNKIVSFTFSMLAVSYAGYSSAITHHFDALAKPSNTLVENSSSHSFFENSGVISQTSQISLDDVFAGAGYVSDNEVPKIVSCIDGSPEVDNSGNTFGSLSFDSSSNYHSTFDDLTIKINGKSSWLNASAKLSSTSQEKNTNIDSTIILRAKYEAPSVRFVPVDSAMPLNNRGLAAYTKGINTFYSICGDSYAGYLKRGGVLDIVIRMSFSNQAFKNKFESEMGVSLGGIQDLKILLNTTKEKYKQNLQIFITASQLGGDPSALGSILGAVDNSDVQACDTANCFSILDSLINYLREDGPLHTSWKERPAVIGITPVNYRDILVDDPEFSWESQVTPEINQARSELYVQLKDQYQNINQIESVLKSTFTPMIQKRWDAIVPEYKALKVLVEENINTLAEALSICYENFDLCLAAKVNAVANLNEISFPRDPSAVYDVSKVTVGLDAESYCSVPESSVVVGLGTRIRHGNAVGVKLKYRTVNVDGSLGSPHYVQCGSEAPKNFVEVPDGYIVTGFGGRVKSSDLQSVYALARRWDSEQRMLVGDTRTFHSGDNYEMMLDLRIHGPTGLDSFFDTDHGVISGAGFRSKSDDIKGLTAKVGYIY